LPRADASTPGIGKSRLALPCVPRDLERLFSFLDEEAQPAPTTVLLPAHLHASLPAPGALGRTLQPGLRIEPSVGRPRVAGNFDECWLFRDSYALRSGRLARAALASGALRFRIFGPVDGDEVVASREELRRALLRTAALRLARAPLRAVGAIIELGDAATYRRLAHWACRRSAGAASPDLIHFFIPTLGLGGAQRQLVALVRALTAEGFRCRVWVHDTQPGFFTSAVEGAGAAVECVWRASGWRGSAARVLWQASSYRSYVLVAAALALALRRERPAVLQSYLDTTNVAAALAGRLARVPLVVGGLRSLHPAARGSSADGFAVRGYDLLLPALVDAVIANSRNGRDSFLEHQPAFPAEKLRVIPNGIDSTLLAPPSAAAVDAARRALDLPIGVPVVVWVGRAAAVKRPELALETAAEAAQGGLDFRLLLVGTGAGSRALAMRAAALGLDGRVVFVAPRHDVAPLMALARVVLLTSEVEGSPNVLLEAQFLARPVVATRVGGVAELVEDGVTGFLAAGDAVTLGRRLALLLRDADLAASMGEAGRRLVNEHFSSQRMAARTLAVYRELGTLRGVAPGTDTVAPPGEAACA